ncbi:Oxoglutarate and iron-dependent oxygenase degradation C-term-domain-containing protein [Gigaspora rosea]|uniref:Oxoglutarate and iron-dependent oxygenase degradation C-term-domain-containing protein n=1 Tax=Gigaspora rosea TaxID=44941 RepID=A0A397UN54_9GLOM|nr:Oxoglutarate and iron-dependent oxygenase degradation C-term-domain-containing protein [Gigaspora rosea]
MKRASSLSSDTSDKKQKLNATFYDSSSKTIESSREYEENFNSNYTQPQFISNFRRALRNRQDFKDPLTNATVYGSPFPIALVPNIFSSQFLESVKAELETEEFYHKSNDLYEFYQSEDLKLSKNPNTIKLRETIYSECFVRTISELTGIHLDSTPDLSAHQYTQGNYLLCHDDDIKDDENMHGRRVAFIIYLVDKDWEKEYGGCLDLFNTDSQGHPNQVSLSITPKWNTMVFFELSPTSYHQVAEVLTSTKVRLSISGWFHGALNTRLSCSQYIPLVSVDPDNYNINEIVNPSYLTEQGIKDILKVLRKEASIELQQFLQQNMYDKLIDSLNKAQWDKQPTGPPFIRRYHLIMNNTDNESPDINSTSPFHQYIYSFFKSTIFANYLAQITRYNISRAYSEIRQFQSGDYTLIHDQALDKEGLDITFCCIEEDWNHEWQGGTHYVAREEELLTIWPKKNTLSIVVRDAGTMRFVKYVNSSARISKREMTFIYLDDDNDDDDDDDYDNDDDDDNYEDIDA